MSNRVLKLINEFGERLKELVDKQTNTNSSINDIFEIICESDPTQNNKNTRWIIQTILNKGFLWEDIQSGEKSKVYDTLSLFEKHRKKINNINQRNINQYKTLGSVYKAISEFSKELSGKEIKQNDKELAYSQSVVFVDNEDGYKIVSPRSVFASKWFGKGTRWCTAADNDNMFNEYNESGPLLIVITPDGRKFQAHKEVNITISDYFNNNEAVFMDEDDEELSEQDIDKYWKYLEPISMYLGKYEYISIDSDGYKTDVSMASNFIENYVNLINTNYSSYEDIVNFTLDVAKENNIILEAIYSDELKQLIDDEYNEDKKLHNIIHKLQIDKRIISETIINNPDEFGNIDNSKKIYAQKILLDCYNKTKDIKYYRNIPYDKKTQEMSNEIFDKYHRISLIENKHHTKSMLDYIVKNNLIGFDFASIKDELITEDILIEYLKYYNKERCLMYGTQVFIEKYKEIIGEDNKSIEEINNLIIEVGNSNLFNILPKKYRTYEKCKEFLSKNILSGNNEEYNFMLENIDILDEDLIKLAMNKKEIKCYDDIDIYKNLDKFPENIKEIFNKKEIKFLYYLNNSSNNHEAIKEILNMVIENKDFLITYKDILSKYFKHENNFQKDLPIDILKNTLYNNKNTILMMSEDDLYHKDTFNNLINNDDNKYTYSLFLFLESKFTEEKIAKMNITENFILDYINKSQNTICYIPEEYQTESVKTQMLNKNPLNKIFFEDDYELSNSELKKFASEICDNNLIYGELNNMSDEFLEKLGNQIFELVKDTIDGIGIDNLTSYYNIFTDEQSDYILNRIEKEEEMSFLQENEEIYNTIRYIIKNNLTYYNKYNKKNISSFEPY